MASDISFDGTDVYINFPYPPLSSLAADASVSVNVEFASTAPGPATLYLTISFLGVFVLFHRRRYGVARPKSRDAAIPARAI